MHLTHGHSSSTYLDAYSTERGEALKVSRENSYLRRLCHRIPSWVALMGRGLAGPSINLILGLWKASQSDSKAVTISKGAENRLERV